MKVEFPIQGFIKPGLESVKQAFARNFSDGIDVGAGFCVYQDGECIVDLWGGYQDRDCSVPWLENTLINIYSTTKGLASMVVALAVQDGCLDYDAPVKKYWPELKAGENGLTVGQLLSHQGGLCGLRSRLSVADLYDWQRMVTLLENAAPLWEPGSAVGYHAITWGYLAGELVHRTLGRKMQAQLNLDYVPSIGNIFAEKIAQIVQAEAFIGLPESALDRVAQMIGPNHARTTEQATKNQIPQNPDTLSEFYKLSLLNPLIGPFRDVSSAEWRCAEIPAANGQATAKGLARIYSALTGEDDAGPLKFVDTKTLTKATFEEVGEKQDLVLEKGLRRGRGFILNTQAQYGPNNGAFGHSGAGGSLAFADPQAKIGFAYVMNQMHSNSEEDTRVTSLVEALYACL